MTGSHSSTLRPITLELARSTIAPWLARTLACTELEVLALKGAGAGSSAETHIATVRGVLDGKSTEFGVVIRRQNNDSDLFLESDLELPCLAMAQVSKSSSKQIPVPRVFGLERNPELLGAPFMAMEVMPGRIVQQSPNYNREGWLADASLEMRGRAWSNALQMMARIHRVDVSRGFEFLDHPQKGQRGLDQYLRWVEDWYTWARAGRPHRITDIAIERLKSSRPRNAVVGLLWGDPQPSNFLFAADGEITGVIDWEMVTLGPPEADLAWWLFFDDLFSTGMGVARLDGLPDRKACIDLYEQALGRSVQNLEYYSLLAAFRMAIIGMRSVDRQIKRGFVPVTTTARENAPIVRLLAEMLGEPLPEVGRDFHQFMGTLGMSASLSEGPAGAENA
jgi:aminoglycoside phosphotransferase (APT) family kinase protein